MTPPRPAFVWSPAYQVDIGRHVFPTEKFHLLKELLVALKVISPEEVETPPKATDEELLTVLTPEYLAALRAYIHSAATIRSELPITRSIIEGMTVSAGGSILCARRALERGLACHLGGGFHHGYPDHAEGFCYINDVAIAAAVVLGEGLARRVAVVDTDVHQGNGTAAAFRGRDDVFTFSIHEEDLYPRPKERSSLDIGLPSFPGRETYLRELDRGLQAAIGGFRPDLVIHAAGVDPFEEDQLGSLGLDRATMSDRDRAVARACFERAIPLMTVVAGGYARRVEDTVLLHARTVEVSVEEWERAGMMTDAQSAAGGGERA